MTTRPARKPAAAPQPDAGAVATALGRLRLRHLQLLDALERVGSLRRAAAELGIAQPAAISLVDDLEHAFGVQLVVREHSGTTLTPTAHAVVARARVALEEIAQAHQHALREDASAGRLRLGASPYLISGLLPDVVAMLRARVPGMQVDIREGTLETLVDDLAGGKLDAVLGSADRAAVLPREGELEVTFLGTDPMVVVAGAAHPLFRKRRASLDEVLPGPWLLPHASSHIRGLVDRAVHDLGRAPIAPQVECRGIHNLMAIAAAGGFVTVAPQAELARATWRGRLAAVQSPLKLRPPPYAIVSRRYLQPVPQLLALRECVQSVAHQVVDARARPARQRP